MARKKRDYRAEYKRRIARERKKGIKRDYAKEYARRKLRNEHDELSQEDFIAKALNIGLSDKQAYTLWFSP